VVSFKRLEMCLLRCLNIVQLYGIEPWRERRWEGGVEWGRRSAAAYFRSFDLHKHTINTLVLCTEMQVT